MSPEMASFALSVLAHDHSERAGELCPCSRAVQTTSGLCAKCDDAGRSGRSLAAARGARTRHQARRAALALMAA